MPRSQPNPKGRPRTARGALARPLDTLIFLLPLIICHEIASLWRQDRVIAFHVLRKFFQWFGPVGAWAPGLAVIVILLATHAASRERWVVHWKQVGWMYVESIALCVPLLLLKSAVRLAAGGISSGVLDRIAQGIGAGIYEELVFRVAIISLLVIVAADVLRFHRGGVAVAAVILSSLAFAAHHHDPIGVEPFDAVPFVFRGVAGVYLAAIFWYRGYGPAAGCHAAYNVALVVLGPMASMVNAA